MVCAKWLLLGASRQYERLPETALCRTHRQDHVQHSVDKSIAIWGFAFKKDTNDTRESAAIHVCRDLLRERARLKIYDPRVSADQVKSELTYIMTDAAGNITDSDRSLIEKNVMVSKSAYAAAEGSHAVAILTEWDEFRTTDLKRVGASMQKPAFMFDGRNVINSADAKAAGFDFHCIGRA